MAVGLIGGICAPLGTLSSLYVERIHLKDFGLGGLVSLTSDQEARVDSCQVQQHSFMEIDHKMFSVVILSLPQIQEGI